jgi:hypothetical protein
VISDSFPSQFGVQENPRARELSRNCWARPLSIKSVKPPGSMEGSGGLPLATKQSAKNGVRYPWK